MSVRSNELYNEDVPLSADVSPNVLIPLQRAPEVSPLAGTPEGPALFSSAAGPITNGWASEDAKPLPEPSAETLRQELAAEHGAAEALLSKPPHRFPYCRIMACGWHLLLRRMYVVGLSAEMWLNGTSGSPGKLSGIDERG